MADTGLGYGIGSPNITGNRRFRSFLNQSQATSGRTPSAANLDQIIQSELETMNRSLAERKRLQETQRQFNIGQQNAMDTAAANRKYGLVGAGTQLLGTALMSKGLGLWGGKGNAVSPSTTNIPTQGAGGTPEQYMETAARFREPSTGTSDFQVGQYDYGPKGYWDTAAPAVSEAAAPAIDSSFGVLAGDVAQGGWEAPDFMEGVVGGLF